MSGREGVQPGASERRPSSRWTCAIHSEVRRTRPGDCPLCRQPLEPVALPRRAS